MTTILIVESNAPEAVAADKPAARYFRSVLALISPDAKTRVVEPYSQSVSDAAFDGVDGVIFTGSGVDWSADAPEAACLREVMQRSFARGLPTYGSCNGLQLAAAVLGGALGASPKGNEIGVARGTTLTEAGRQHPFLAGRQDGYAVPCIHRDEVQGLPDGAVLLAGNAHSPVQAMVYEQDGISFWGVQYHPEMAALDVAHILRSIAAEPGENADLIADLEGAEVDQDSAGRLGSDPAAMQWATRTLEISNWMAMVAEGAD